MVDCRRRYPSRREKLKPEAPQVPWVQAARSRVSGILSSCIGGCRTSELNPRVYSTTLVRITLPVLIHLQNFWITHENVRWQSPELPS